MSLLGNGNVAGSALLAMTLSPTLSLKPSLVAPKGAFAEPSPSVLAAWEGPQSAVCYFLGSLCSVINVLFPGCLVISSQQLLSVLCAKHTNVQQESGVMYVCVYACVSVYICFCVCIYVCVYASCMYVNLCIYICMHVCVYLCLYVNVCVYISMCICVHV